MTEAPAIVVQAGMGGGIAGGRLAGAVSAAGGLGTVGHADPQRMAQEIGVARGLTDRPIAANVLLPFARGGHWPAVAAADIVVTFWGRPERPPGARAWWHQSGSTDEARAAEAAGADAVIAQGVEAGGHVRGTTPALELLAAVREAVAVPVLLAGGVAVAADVERALAAGAAGVVAGTRFVLSEESGAHPDYKRRLCAASETVVTDLFGLGWPAPHRVVENAALRRWQRAPGWMRPVNRLVGGPIRRLPQGPLAGAAAVQRPALPLLSPLPPTADGPAGMVDAAPLYAGESVARISDVRPAADIVRDLHPR